MILIDLVPQLSHLFHLNANSFREDFCSWGPCSWSLFRRAWGSKSKLPTGPPPSAFPPLILWLLVVAAAARFGHDIEFLSMLEDPMEAVTVNTFWHIRVESTLNLHQVIHANRRRTSHYFSLCPCLSLSLLSSLFSLLSSLFSLLSSLFSLLSSLSSLFSLCLSLPLSASLCLSLFVLVSFEGRKAAGRKCFFKYFQHASGSCPMPSRAGGAGWCTSASMLARPAWSPWM